MNGVVFDLETTGLDAVGPGFAMCMVYKPLNSRKIEVLRYDTLGCAPGREKTLVKRCLEALEQFDLLIGHNIRRYDINFLHSRAAQLGIPSKLNKFYYDTMLAFKRTGYLTVPNIIGKPTASLAHVIDFFDIRLTKKYPIYPRQHWKAVWQTGHQRRKAMDHIVEHCKADVLANEQVYWHLLRDDRLARLERV